MTQNQTGNLPAQIQPNLWLPTSFEDFQRKANALSNSTLVPETYRGNIANCMVAIELAGRLNLSPFLVMQNLHVIGGRPSWSANYLIACLNTCGKFSTLEFETKDDGTKNLKTFFGEKETQISIQNLKCRAVATDVKTGKQVFGSWVSVEMAYLEGWATKKGSKWKTMPEQMLQYRAASFFSRVHAPEITLGFHTTDEIADGANQTVEVEGIVVESGGKAQNPVATVNDQIKKKKPAPDEQVVEFETVVETEPEFNNDEIV